MRIVLTTLLIAIASLTTQAQDFRLIQDLGVSAKMISIGNIEGFSNSSSEIFGNPAALSSVKQSAAHVFTTQLFGETTFNSLTIASKTPFFTVGVGYMEANVDDLPITAVDPTARQLSFIQTGAFDYKDTITKLTIQRAFGKHISLAASGVRYTRRFEQITGDGYNIDLGAQFYADNLTAGLSVKNAIANRIVAFNDGGRESLPSQGTASLGYKIGDIQLMSQFQRYRGKNLVSFGSIYSPFYVPMIEISGGYQESLDAIGTITRDYVFGLTLTVDIIEFSYAYKRSEVPAVDNHNFFSVSINL